ncbi:MAG: DUF456 family protein [Kiritimatiellae bacterium]|jgi:uncharacterized protein YqgC (DUF456 family)|nr:DUF456 family protein [Kiritimatiellia bacterium]
MPEILAFISDAPWSHNSLLALWVIFYILLLLAGGVLNVLGLAGNWVVLGASVMHLLVTDAESRIGYGFGIPLTLLILALLGELLEFLAGLLGAGKAGGSRRAMVLSMLGGIVGSLFGFSIGNVFFPVIGGIVGIFVVAGLGALAGAMLGETWKGRGFEESMRVGRGAFTGRILGTLGKTLVGSLMLMIALLALVL